MLARCARCQGTFTTDHFGRNTCPHCGSELVLADPNAPATPPSAPSGPPGSDAWAPPPPAGGGWTPPPPQPGFGAGPGPGPGPVPEMPAPFAERKTRGFFHSFFETWKLVATEPRKFFTHVRIDQTGTALLFGVLAAWAGGAVGTLLNTLSSRAQLAQARQSIQTLPPELAPLGEFMSKYLDLVAGGTIVGVEVVAAPVMALLGIFVTAGVVHLFLLMFKGAARGFQATLTVVAFSYGIHLLAAVPQCGSAISSVWQLVLLIIGLAAIHRTDVWKSAVAVLAPGILCCCCTTSAITAAIVGAVGHGHAGGGVTNL